MTLDKLNSEEAKKRQKEIIDLVTSEVKPRSKLDLIEKFIEENLPKLKLTDSVINECKSYWAIQSPKKKAFQQLYADEKIKPELLEKLMQNLRSLIRLSHQHEIVSALELKPLIKERKSILEHVADKIQTFINTF